MTPKRVIRHDAHIVSNREAAEWLRKYGEVVEITLRRFRPGARRSRWYDEEDLRSVGRMAVIEAVETYDPKRGCSERTWVGRTIGWRMRAAVQESFGDGRARDPGEPMPAWACEQVVEPSSSDDLYALADRIATFIAALDLADRHIFTEHLMGESAAHIGLQNGMSSYQVRQRIASVEAKLRAEIVSSSTVTLEGSIELGLDGVSVAILVTTPD